MRWRIVAKFVCGTLIVLPAVAVLSHVVQVRQIRTGAPPASAAGGVRDPWGNPIQYETLVSDDGATHIRAWSLGPDGKPATGDEIYGEYKRQPKLVPPPKPDDTL